jgi:hypothetical protein
MFQTLYVSLQFRDFLFQGTEFGACEWTGEFLFGGALAVFVAEGVEAEVEGGFEEDGCGDEGDEHRGDEARHGGQGA